MQNTAKITISLPKDLLETIEKERDPARETRSQLVRRLLQAYLRQKREREDIEQYIRGYQQYPETEEELQEAEAMFKAGLAAMAQDPWDEENKQ